MLLVQNGSCLLPTRSLPFSGGWVIPVCVVCEVLQDPSRWKPLCGAQDMLTVHLLTLILATHRLWKKKFGTFLLQTGQAASCKYRTRTSAQSWEGWAGLGDAMISIKLILILQRGLIFQWCFCFPLTVQAICVSGSWSRWRQLYKLESIACKRKNRIAPCPRARPAVHSNGIFWSGLKKALYCTIAYWLQWSMWAFTFTFFLAGGRARPWIHGPRLPTWQSCAQVPSFSVVSLSSP